MIKLLQFFGRLPRKWLCMYCADRYTKPSAQVTGLLPETKRCEACDMGGRHLDVRLYKVQPFKVKLMDEARALREEANKAKGSTDGN